MCNSNCEQVLSHEAGVLIKNYQKIHVLLPCQFIFQIVPVVLLLVTFLYTLDLLFWHFHACFVHLQDIYPIEVLTSDIESHSEVPRTVKENVYFLVDHSANLNRKANAKYMKFWDNCGTWDTTRNPFLGGYTD
jgi:hypothetical protein